MEVFPRRKPTERGWLQADRRQWLLGGLVWCALGARAAPAEASVPPRTLRFSRIGQGPEIDRVESALREAYGRLTPPWKTEFVAMPAARALVESNQGRMDGETARIAGLEAEYANLHCVAVPLYINTNSAFVFGAGRVAPDSLDALQQLGRVGIVGGWKTAEEATTGWRNVVRVSSHLSALQMLKLGRLDAFLGRSEDSVRTLLQQGVRLADYPNQVVLRAPLFHYLHQKHADLVPAITRELQQLQGKRPAVVDSWMP